MQTTTRIATLLAIFAALTGTAYAVDGPLAGQNTVGSEDIIDSEVRSADVANGSVQTADIKNDDVRSSDVRDDTLPDGGLVGADIAPNSLTGADIVEPTLDPVPFAMRASEVSGVTFRPIEFRAGQGERRQVLNIGGLTLTADCNINGLLNVWATASSSAIVASYSTSTTDADETALNEVYRINPGSTPVQLLGQGGRRDDLIGHTIFHGALGDVVAVDWLADNSGMRLCDFVGTATHH